MPLAITSLFHQIQRQGLDRATHKSRKRAEVARSAVLDDGEPGVRGGGIPRLRRWWNVPSADPARRDL